MLLTVKNLNIFYGVIHAVQGVSFGIEKGEIITLLGANGAGKTSILSAISNIIPIHSGSVIFEGKEITNIPPHKIVESGIVHVPEGRHIFSDLTVNENLFMGAYTRKDHSEIQEDLEKSFVLFPQLKKKRKQLAGTLSGGEQQMLAMARGFMGHPMLLLLDEPSMGLAPVIVEEVFNNILEMNKQGISIILVEQNSEMALSVAHKGYVLEGGNFVLQGPAKKLIRSKLVQEAYLGKINN